MLSGSRSTVGLLGGQSFLGVVLILILPGAVGAAPWVALLVALGVPLVSETVRRAASGYETSLVTILLLGSALLFGMLFREMGTYIEYELFDTHPGRGTQDDLDRDWREFLRTVYKRIPIGHRYLRVTLQTYFFELSILGAFVSLGLGIAVCRSTNVIGGDPCLVAALVAATFTVATFAANAAQDSHEALASVRHLLVNPLRRGLSTDKELVARRPRHAMGWFRRFSAFAALVVTLICLCAHAVYEHRLSQCGPAAFALLVLTACQWCLVCQHGASATAEKRAGKTTTPGASAGAETTSNVSAVEPTAVTSPAAQVGGGTTGVVDNDVK